MISPAAAFPFARAVAEYARWRAVAEDDRSPAPAWWWATAFALRDAEEPLPEAQATMLALEHGASHGDGARLMLRALAGQQVQPWPEEFPHRYR